MQKNIFSNYEGDDYLKRTKKVVLSRLENNLFSDMNLLFPLIKKNFKILEIGCSFGAKLHYLNTKLPSMNLELHGIDPSANSIEEGVHLYPDLNLKIGTSDSLDYETGFFDLIIVGFCFYVVDRELIFKSVSEIDRVLKSGKFLSISDFEPLYPTVSKYRNDEKLKVYKNNYSNFFIPSNHYSLVSKIHQTNSVPNTPFSTESKNRVSVSVLYKELYKDIYL